MDLRSLLYHILHLRYHEQISSSISCHRCPYLQARRPGRDVFHRQALTVLTLCNPHRDVRSSLIHAQCIQSQRLPDHALIEALSSQHSFRHAQRYSRCWVCHDSDELLKALLRKVLEGHAVRLRIVLRIDADLIVATLFVGVLHGMLMGPGPVRELAKHEIGLRGAVALTEGEDVGPVEERGGASDGLGRGPFASGGVVVVVEFKGGRGDVRGVGEGRCGNLDEGIFVRL